MHALVMALTFALGSSGTLPLWATLLGVEEVHACHCSRDHHDCVCARCHSDPDGAMRVSTETLQNRCGDDETVFGGRRILAVTAAPSAVVVATVSDRIPAGVRRDSMHSRDRTEPATPPPPRIG